MQAIRVRNILSLRGAVLLLGLVAALAAVGGLSPSRWWTGANTVNILELMEKAGGSPVSFEGDLTYYDAPHATAVMEDNTSAIAIAVPPGVPIKVGQRIRLSGTLPKDYDPTAPVALALDAPVFTTLQTSVPLPLRRIKIGDLYGAYEPDRFEVTGTVKSAVE